MIIKGDEELIRTYTKKEHRNAIENESNLFYM